MLKLNDGAEEIPQAHPGTAQDKMRKKIGTFPKIVFGAALLLVIPLLGNTFAGSITINNAGQRVEFGQGIVSAVVCDSTGVTITPTASYRNSDFVLETLTVTGVDLSANACRGKTLSFYVIDTSSALANWYTTGNVAGIAITDTGTAGTKTPSAGSYTATVSAGGTTNETVTIVVTAGWLSSTYVSKFIIQSS